MGKLRLYNACIYFLKNTKYCYKTKLFKLLYELDFKHFELTGSSVTGQKYVAWQFGPFICCFLGNSWIYC